MAIARFTELFFTEMPPLMAVVTLILLWNVFWGVILQVYFVLKLNPLFDPHFKSHLSLRTELAPGYSRRVARSGIYCSWVACKEWFGRRDPKVQAFDFRGKVSMLTYHLCWFQMFNGVVLILAMTFLLIGKWAGTIN